MATYTIEGIDITTVQAAVDLPSFNAADYVFVDTVELDKNRGRETVYQRIVGSPVSPMTIRYGHYPSADGEGANNSVKIVFDVVKTDGDVITRKPGNVVLATSVPFGGGVISADLYRAILGNALSALCQGLGGVNEDVPQTKLMYGVTRILE